MQPIIEIFSTTTHSKDQKRKSDGGVFTIFEQRAFLHQIDKFTGEVTKAPIVVTVKDENSAYPVGCYGIDEKSFRINSFQSLEQAKIVLCPLQKVSVASAPQAGKLATAA